MWLGRLPRTKIENIEELVTNMEGVSNMQNSGQCLTLIRNGDDKTYTTETSGNTNLISLRSGLCNEEHLALCKINNVNENVLINPPPKFPCMLKNNRRKRSVISNGI